MKFTKSAVFCSVASLLLMTACTSYEPRHNSNGSASNSTRYDNRYEGRVGNITNIETFETSSRTSGGGAILGALVGGALGNQVGKGDGRKAATVAGVVGGAVAGNAIERHNKRDSEFFRISVRFDNGSNAQYDYNNIDDLQVGDRVRVSNGQVNRL
ncbi:MAG: glycine zipper 2TM domain-containing protein [Arenimonas sp.]